MYDYGRLVFLDNQKTGSTYVSHFLQSCCVLDLVKAHKHRPVRNDFRSDTVYFSTVRNPFDVYISLFQYGRERHGSTFKNLRKIGRVGLYKSFPRWLNFVLEEENAPILQEGYEHVAPLGIGFMSFRAMRITLRNPDKTMAAAKSYDDLIDVWAKHNIASHILRQEDLNLSLYKFASETVPDFFNQDAVEIFFDKIERVNSSTPTEKKEISKDLMQRIIQKEKFLIERFYPKKAEPDFHIPAGSEAVS